MKRHYETAEYPAPPFQRFSCRFTMKRRELRGFAEVTSPVRLVKRQCYTVGTYPFAHGCFKTPCVKGETLKRQPVGGGN